MKHVCRRYLTAFRSLDILYQHMERCIKQQSTKIKFSWKDQMNFEDYHMTIPLPFRVHADFECVNQHQDTSKVLFTQHQIAVDYYIVSPFGNQYYSYFGKGWVK